MAITKRIVLFSHGFGVDKTGRGLFTDVCAALPETEYVMFDYNRYDQDGNMYVNSIDQEVEILQERLDALPADAHIDIIAHSQGCIITALADLPQNIRQIILLAPPLSFDTQRRIEYFKQRKGALIDLEGESRVPRRDGTLTFIPADFWHSLDVDVEAKLKQLTQQYKVTIIKAVGDEVVGDSDFSAFENTTLVEIPADHNFTGKSRQALAAEISKIL